MMRLNEGKTRFDGMQVQCKGEIEEKEKIASSCWRWCDMDTNLITTKENTIRPLLKYYRRIRRANQESG